MTRNWAQPRTTWSQLWQSPQEAQTEKSHYNCPQIMPLHKRPELESLFLMESQDTKKTSSSLIWFWVHYILQLLFSLRGRSLLRDLAKRLYYSFKMVDQGYPVFKVRKTWFGFRIMKRERSIHTAFREKSLALNDISFDEPFQRHKKTKALKKNISKAFI